MVDVAPNNRLVFIDALRGVAAMGVVLFHAEEGHHIPELLVLLPYWFQSVIEHGNLGVPIFFVLSGFVIAHSLYGQRMNGNLFGRFTLRRSLRLDPPYWVAIAISIGFATLASTVVSNRPSETFTLGQVVAHLFYLQDILRYREIDTVFWTLCFEVQFYLVYAILLAVGRNDPGSRFQGRRTAALLLVAGMVSLLWPLRLGPELPAGLFPPLWHAFLLGVGAYWSWRDRGALPFFAAYALIIGTSAIIQGDQFSLACTITAATLYVVGVADRLHTALNWRWLQFLGAISYSLYLIHNPITGASFRVGYMLTGRSIFWEAFWWSVSIAACIAVAGALWWAIERPSTRLARKIRFSSSLDKSRQLVPTTP